jgi:hypothetical protein
MLAFNIGSFIELLEKDFFPKEKLVSFCGIETDITYFYDIMVAGSTIQVIEFFKNDQTMEDNRCIEMFLLESKLNKTDITRDDVREVFNFCYKECRSLGIEFFLIKYQHCIINDYCYCSFIWD